MYMKIYWWLAFYETYSKGISQGSMLLTVEYTFLCEKYGYVFGIFFHLTIYQD